MLAWKWWLANIFNLLILQNIMSAAIFPNVSKEYMIDALETMLPLRRSANKEFQAWI